MTEESNQNKMKHTLEREYVRRGADFKLYHIPSFKKPYLLILKYPDMEEKDTLVVAIDNFVGAHKEFNFHRNSIAPWF